MIYPCGLEMRAAGADGGHDAAFLLVVARIFARQASPVIKKECRNNHGRQERWAVTQKAAIAAAGHGNGMDEGRRGPSPLVVVDREASMNLSCYRRQHESSHSENTHSEASSQSKGSPCCLPAAVKRSTVIVFEPVGVKSQQGQRRARERVRKMARTSRHVRGPIALGRWSHSLLLPS